MDNQYVLAMYDVRGIQGYIFATNEVHDIIGASNLVENIILKGLESIIKKHQEWDEHHFLVNWEQDTKIVILEDKNIVMQVLFIGGGNAYVLFRDREVCKTVNRELAKYVLENTYSLNLAVAVVPKSESYLKDYDAINLEMRKVKARMVPVKPIGSMPFMKTDSITGYPLTGISRYGGQEEITTESKCKQACLEKEKDPAKIFDNMVTQKGDNSTLAVIHIDGNSMGSRIKDIMRTKANYRDAVSTMREISQNISKSFLDAFDDMCKKMDEKSALVKKKSENKLYRRIIIAGDDITFVCNPKLAFMAVETFIQSVTEKDMYRDEALSDAENHKKYGFSACAGIAFFNSHFPFSDAYQVAEACCGSAKSAAKEKEHRNGGAENGLIGCYIDYQFCVNIRAAQLKEYRDRHYSYSDDPGSMLMRPYYIHAAAYSEITDLEERNRDRSMETLWTNLRAFTAGEEGKNIVRSHAKKLRSAYAVGLEEVDRFVTFLVSRDVKLPETDRTSWYDALEFMDFYEEGIR